MTFAEAVMSRPKRGPPPREPRATIGGEQSLEAFESHFHLDRLSWALGQTWSETMRNLNRPTDVAVRQPVQLVGGVMVFCDPEEFHKLPFLDNHFVSAVGIHPKKAHMCTQGRLDQLKADHGITARPSPLERLDWIAAALRKAGPSKNKCLMRCCGCATPSFSCCYTFGRQKATHTAVMYRDAAWKSSSVGVQGTSEYTYIVLPEVRNNCRNG